MSKTTGGSTKGLIGLIALLLCMGLVMWLVGRFPSDRRSTPMPFKSTVVFRVLETDAVCYVRIGSGRSLTSGRPLPGEDYTAELKSGTYNVWVSRNGMRISTIEEYRFLTPTTFVDLTEFKPKQDGE